MIHHPDLATTPTVTTLLEGVPDGVVVSDAGGTITFVNRRLEELTGFGREELLGRSVEALVPLRHREQHVVDRASFDAQGRSRPMGRSGAVVCLRRDGSEIPVHVSLTPSRRRTDR
ncbi:MAG: PAS domain S-box protein [Acidimicrobiia bacterium]|nr:PAS domain S-box protein [Acidimicrobiia bacterium]